VVGALYLEHLSDSDLALLMAASEPRIDTRREPERIEELLNSPALFRTLFGAGRDPLVSASPFLLFAVVVHRAARDLRQASFIEEWVGPRQRVPVFDVGGLRDFGADPLRRFFLAELLASYSHVASGSMLVQTSRGWRRRRFSELDPLRLIELAEVVSPSERPGVYRRLGDLTLFLSGIFPDYAADRLIVSHERRRLQRALDDRDRERAEQQDGIWLLERLGRRAYRLARQATGGRTAMAEVLDEVSRNFATARRVLNFLTDRYLFPLRQRWFGVG
jgi:hypothetical protein